MTIAIYSKNNCVYCDKAKALLKNKNMEYTEFKLDVDFSMDEIKELFPSARTFPIIVMNDEYIGGYTQLELKLN